MKFELKKIIKNKIFLIFILASLIFALFISFIKKADIDYSLIDGLEDVNVLDRVLEKDNDLSFKLSDTYPPTMVWEEVTDDFNKDYQKIVGQIDYDEMVLSSDEYLGENPPIMRASFFEDILNFIDKYKLKTSPLNEQKLIFLREFYINIESRELSPESFIKNIRKSSQNIFYSNIKIYFGLVPVLLISLFVGASLSRDYENGQAFLKLTSIRKRIWILIDKLSLGLFLAFIYFLTIVLTSLLIGKINGDYDWIFTLPIGSFGENQNQVVFAGFLWKTFLIFMARVFFFSSAFISLGLIFKNTNIFLETVVFISGVLGALTGFYEKLQIIYNPFYFSYYDFILGNKKLMGNIKGRVDFSYQSPSFKLSLIGIYLLFGILFLIIAYCFIKFTKGKICRNKIKKERIEVKDLLSFEKLKIKSFSKNTGLSFTLIALILLIFSINLRSKMTSKDFYAYKNTFMKIAMIKDGANFIENSNTNDKDKDPNLASKAEAYMDKLNDLDRLKEASDSENFYKILSKASLFAESLGDELNPNLTDEHFKVSEGNLINGKISEFSKQASHSFRKELISRDIKPMNLIYDRSLTYYDKLKDERVLDAAIKAQIPKDTSSFILFLKLINESKLPILLIMISLFIYGGAYKYEFINENSYDLLRTQPLDLRKVYDKKFLASLSFCLKFLLVTSLAIVILGIFNDPRHTLNFPILKYLGRVADPNLAIDYSKDFIYISLGRYLFDTMILSLSLLVFLLSLVQLLSLIVKDMFKIYIALAFIIVMMFLILYLFRSYSYLNPLTYFLAEEIVDGSLSVKYGISHFDSYIGSIYLILLGILIYVIGRKLARII